MMGCMPKPRNPENKGFPTGWRRLHGAIYYSVPKGLEPQWDDKQLFRLGKSPSEAYGVWADRLGTMEKAKKVSHLLDRYALQVIPTKAPKSQTSDLHHIKKLRAVFGDMVPTGIKPVHIYQFVDKSEAKVSARRAMALLSHVFTMAVRWGDIERHPFKGEVRLEGEKPRTRFIEDWEIDESMALKSFRKAGSVLAIQAYMLIKQLTGLRRNDILMIKMDTLKDDGIHVMPNKTKDTTGIRLIISWSDALRAAVEVAKAARPVDISPWLFCKEDGTGYHDIETGEAHGWSSMWQRFMDRLIEETKITERFTDKDLRAKAGSESKTLELAQKLLGHSSSAITDRVYRRKPKIVEPVR